MILENKSDRTSAINSSPGELNLEIELERKEVPYQNLSDRFICLQKDFNKQFAHIYACRLTKVKDRLARACIKKWGNQIPIRKLSELCDENNEKCVVMGTLFKHQELKPSILRDLSDENHILPQPTRSNYVSDNDLLILEDEIQRIRLVGAFDIKKLVTGVVIGLLGFENLEGKFEVEDLCFADFDENPEKPLKMFDEIYIILISGLSLGSSENLLALELVIDWIKGELGSVPDQETQAKFCRVLIAGNSIMDSHSSKHKNVINTEIEDNLDTLTAVKQLDDLLLELVQTVEIDIMPGEFDPSNHNLPQQAFYECVFPKTSQYNSFHCVTNPYECCLGGWKILGTSGQPIDDIKGFTDFTQSLDVLENTLIWGHMAPTAPDTLACYPYYDNDPFVITEQPDIYFAGNQPEFKTKLFNLNGYSTRLVCIPSFSSTQTCALLNLKTLECTPLTISL